MTQIPMLHHVELGHQGQRIVLLPGVGGTTRYWADRVAPLAVPYRLHLVDLLGFGDSPKPWLIRYTVERHLDELDRVVAPLTTDAPIVFVGHSFGAILALAYAARWPERVAGLVLISLPHFGGQRRAVQYLRHRGTAEGWLLSNVVLAAITCLFTRRVARHILPRVLSDMPKEVVEDLVKHTWRSSTSTVWEGVYRHNVGNDVKRLPRGMPILLLHGENDKTAPLSNLTPLLGPRPEWECRILAGVDHHPLLRRPTECLAAIVGLIQSIPSVTGQTIPA